MGIVDSYGVELRHPTPRRTNWTQGHFQSSPDCGRQVLRGSEPVRADLRLGLRWGQCARPDFSPAVAAVQWPDGCAGGLRVSLGGGGSGQCDDLPARTVECADESGDGIFNAECEVGFQRAGSLGVSGF